MKRYIPAVLIPCLLLQMMGCYTLKTIQNDEIKFYENETIVIKTTDEKEYMLKKDVSDREIFYPGVQYCNEYELKNDSLLLISSKTYASTVRYDSTGSPIVKIKTDSIYIPNTLISEIGIRSVNPWSYVVIAGVLIGTLMLIGRAVVANNIGSFLEEMNW